MAIENTLFVIIIGFIFNYIFINKNNKFIGSIFNFIISLILYYYSSLIIGSEQIIYMGIAFIIIISSLINLLYNVIYIFKEK